MSDVIAGHSVEQDICKGYCHSDEHVKCKGRAILSWLKDLVPTRSDVSVVPF